MANSGRETGFLSQGSMVEVKIEGAWYEGDIITQCAESKDQFRVQSKDSNNCYEKKLRYVHISLIRPRPPPPAANQSYEPHDVVDILFYNGWWKGVVSGVYTLEGQTSYTVELSENPPYFKDKVFTSKEMRFHLVWTYDATWVRPPNPEIPNHKKSGQKTTGVAKCSKKRPRKLNALAAENPNDEQSEIAKNEDLPFRKSSHLWKEIDSLEVFRKLPQNPHFSPLKNFNANTREGMAMGHFWTFASLVEKVSKLQIEDPTSIFEGYLEALNMLEMVGFDVKAVVDRINELLAFKTKKEQLVVELKEMFQAKASSPW